MSEFWEMTPYELNLTAEGYWERQKIKQKSDQKQLTYQAYLISRWVWNKDIKIEEILESIDENQQEKKVMTDEQMLNQVKMLNSLFGGEVKENS
ncbi:hypothetical protein [Schnuerera sp.]|uniref:hypothetical protein n=1 Tax=Schnuerera sp. TaxID=2794844 RepID=UPI002D807951|nr:hypothetical protein [Schnuerera sp.]